MASIPKPFQRPSIDLGAPHKREWGNWKISDLTRGDIIPDVGAVSFIDLTSTQFRDPPAAVLELKITNVVGDEHTLKFNVDLYSDDPIPTIWAFH